MLMPASTISMHTDRKARKGEPMDNGGLLDEINGQSKEIASQRRQQNLALEVQEANAKEADEVEEVGF